MNQYRYIDMTSNISKIKHRCVYQVVQDRTQHDMNRYTECNTTCSLAVQDNMKHIKTRLLYSKFNNFNSAAQDRQQEIEMKEMYMNSPESILSDMHTFQYIPEAYKNIKDDKLIKASNLEYKQIQELQSKIATLYQELDKQHHIDMNNWYAGKPLVDNTKAIRHNIAVHREMITSIQDSIDEHAKVHQIEQLLSDARVALYTAYSTGVDVVVAEEHLIAVREQYKRIYGYVK